MLKSIVKFNFTIIGNIKDEPTFEIKGDGLYAFKGSVPEDHIDIIQSRLFSVYIIEKKNINLVSRHTITLDNLEYKRITGDFVWETADFTYEESETECFMRMKNTHFMDTSLTTTECVRDVLVALGGFVLTGYCFRLLFRH